MTALRPQWSAGKRSPRSRSTSSIKLNAMRPPPPCHPHPAQAGVAPRNVTAAAESIRRSVTDKLADGFYMTTALTLRPGEDVLSA